MPNILLVEDDKMLGQVITDALSEAELAVTWVRNGEEALVKVKEGKWDLLYLDIMLTGIDGYEVLRQVKADPLTSKIKVVMLSNLGQMEEMEKAMQLGASDYVIKANIDLKKLVELTKTKFLAVA
jgi:CheY-like chemotaxis protein